jgi:hypothetical protein
VESLTALVEHHDGRLEIVDWSDRRRVTPLTTSQPLTEGAPALGAVD